MSINASRLVSIQPSVLSGGSSDLETIGLLLTQNELIPSGTPCMEFTTASSVSDYFGAESDEYKFAAQYFAGINNQQKAVERLMIARRIAEDSSAWIRGTVSVKLADLKLITDGSLSITVNGTAKEVTGIDLSEATSLSEVAELVAEAIGDVGGSYNSDLGVFIFTTTATGEDATIDYAEDGDEGTGLASILGLTQDAGAVLSQGADAETASENMDAIATVSRNWVGFTTLYATDVEEDEALATWADIDDDYVYFMWDTDSNMLNQLTQESTKAYELAQQNFNCLAVVYGGWIDAASFLAVGASIKWDANQGIKTWFAKSASGISATVLSDSEAEALDDLKVNYVGGFATRNSDFEFMNRGCMLSGIYEYLDVIYGMIWFKAKLQVSIMDGFAATNRVPYTPSGFAFIEAWLLDPINSAKKVGVIDVGMTLSQSQVQTLMSQSGNSNIESDLYSKGYWYKIEAPEASVRSERGTPDLYLIYAYAGSCQKIELPLEAVL